jgi:hypothetical protein
MNHHGGALIGICPCRFPVAGAGRSRPRANDGTVPMRNREQAGGARLETLSPGLPRLKKTPAAGLSPKGERAVCCWPSALNL